MGFTVVSRFATIVMGHTTAFASKAMNSLMTTSHAMVRRFTHTFSYCHSSRYYLTIVQTLTNVKEDSVNVIKIVTIQLDRIPVPVTWAFLSTMMGYSAMVSITYITTLYTTVTVAVSMLPCT